MERRDPERPRIQRRDEQIPRRLLRVFGDDRRLRQDAEGYTGSTSNPIPRQLSRTWRNSAPNTTACSSCSSEALQLFSSKGRIVASEDRCPARHGSLNQSFSSGPKTSKGWRYEQYSPPNVHFGRSSILHNCDRRLGARQQLTSRAGSGNTEPSAGR